ncbi:hypothetical protein RirG_250880 [Rhizophagus irregularis DAOM 197198w]|uniref:Uncharacterized protein n=1 Tax=Rhizophagus irregularis (strain DAOM 197198w) TaxID=1432141 RepID=A0A015LCX7_RHIIW|nr:hypothetical protein RirG_250880 [Rhizophagus irregularis DAOM 197198w]
MFQKNLYYTWLEPTLANETSDLDERIGTPDSDSLMKPDLTLMRELNEAHD